MVLTLVIAYDIGTMIEYSKRAAHLHLYVKGENFLLDNLKRLHDELKENNLSKTTQADIERMITQFEKSYGEEDRISDIDSRRLYESTKLWHDRMHHDLLQRRTIEVFTEGTLNTSKLLEGGKGFFPDDIWVKLSRVSKSDLNDACNCLLTKSWTPAVMISLRAAEDSIRKFYEFKTNNGSQNSGWKSLLDELSKIKGINKLLLGYLDYIRGIRNTAEHPDEIFDQMEAERLFHLVVNMIIVIYQEMDESFLFK